MAQKAPMIGVVVSPSLLRRLKEAQARERRKSLSEFCALLLEYAESKLQKSGIALPDLLASEAQTEISRGVYEEDSHRHPEIKKIKHHKSS